MDQSSTCGTMNEVPDIGGKTGTSFRVPDMGEKPPARVPYECLHLLPLYVFELSCFPFRDGPGEIFFDELRNIRQSLTIDFTVVVIRQGNASDKRNHRRQCQEQMQDSRCSIGYPRPIPEVPHHRERKTVVFLDDNPGSFDELLRGFFDEILHGCENFSLSKTFEIGRTNLALDKTYL
ncbi:hypothetical protein AVEN_188043-1 [Araneus ventricosus]|uniref:Uncharacterized protein n=1 Tax=Araneus ventricosus TaxID=182803 RepID=A0A4Y2V839_ARAVE|nr:hypothetical protein AVEN_188043-1 [Araneus ventricosus]